MQNNFDFVNLTDGFINFLKSSWISLLIIGLFVALILQMDQGSIVVVDLLDKPFNLFLFLLITNVFSVVLSLYPVYLSKWREDVERSETIWMIRPKWLFEALGLGIVQFKSNAKDENISYTKPITRHSYESIFRKFVGVIFYLCILHSFLVIADKYFFSYQFEQTKFIYTIALVLYCLVLAFFYYVSSQNRKKTTVQKFKLPLYTFLILSVLFAILSVALSAFKHWSFITLAAVYLHLFFSMLYFIIYRKFRRVLKENNISPLFLSWLSNDYDYLKMTTAGGWLTLIVFVFSQLQPESFNPIVIIFSIFYVIYGFLVIPIKHYLFYYQKRAENFKFIIPKVLKPVFVYLFPFIVPGSILALILFSKLPNNQHQLETIRYEESNVLTESEYINAFKKHFNEANNHCPKCNEKVYFIASYGGGLRANFWTLKVLNNLTQHYVCEEHQTSVFDRTASLSGVSGGGFGVALYQPLFKEYNSFEARDSIIDEVGLMNPLSRDVAWLLGSDFLGEMNLKGAFNQSNDRAIEVLKDYNNTVSTTEDMLTVPYQEYAKDTQNKLGFYPATFVNTASYSQKRGLSSSIQFKEFSKVFPNTIDILDIGKNKTLSYLSGVSPTHRFPFFSPGAKIENKSIFIDGGYFENSGMLTTIDFKNFLEQKGCLNDKKVTFVQIKNGDIQYASEFLNRTNVNLENSQPQVKDSGEIGTVVKAITSVSAISNYYEDQLRQQAKDSTNMNYVTISLPYRVTEPTVKNLLFVNDLNKDILTKISNHNNELERDLNWFAEFTKTKTDANIYHFSEVAIEPALARLLTDKTVNYVNTLLLKDDSIFMDLEEDLYPAIEPKK